MEIYFYMDYARKACVTPCPNLVTKSQSMQNHLISEGKSHIGSVVLRRNSLRASGFFGQDFDKKYDTVFRNCLATRSVFHLF